MSKTQARELMVGSIGFRYEAIAHWDQLPDGWDYIDVVAIATDDQDRVYVLNRGEHPLIVYDRAGRFLRSWGEGLFQRPHGLWIDDGVMFVTDDIGHAVYKFTLGGEPLLTLGLPNRPSDSGVKDFDYRTIKQGAGPFNLPTNLAVGPEGELFVTDGYGNARVHRFSPDGELILSWGDPGNGPGQFNLPHGIFLDSNRRVFVADRENNRLQIFSTEGRLLDHWEAILRPTQIYIDANDHVYVAEEGHWAGLFPWMQPDPSSSGGRLSIFDGGGKLLSRWGGGERPTAPDDFFAPHDIWLDSRGDIYVGEVTWAAGGNQRMVPRNCPSIRKFCKR